MGVKNPKLPMVDMTNPQQFKQSVQNIANTYRASSETARREGPHWYHRVNEAVGKGVKGTSMTPFHGAGIVAAVSPNMDWEKNNIGAFDELKHLKQADWDTIQKSHDQQMTDKAAGRKYGRTGDASSVLRGMSISTAADGALLKANRIMQGEHPDTVLNRRTAPKTNAFAHNIHEPDVDGPVTIDGRAHDIAANRMQGWGQDRGISSAGLKTGKPTRYEHFEDSYRAAADAIEEHSGARLLPHQVQAVTWVGGKEMERSGLTKSGKPRKVGVQRSGQPYV